MLHTIAVQETDCLDDSERALPIPHNGVPIIKSSSTSSIRFSTNTQTPILPSRLTDISDNAKLITSSKSNVDVSKNRHDLDNNAAYDGTASVGGPVMKSSSAYDGTASVGGPVMKSSSGRITGHYANRQLLLDTINDDSCENMPCLAQPLMAGDPDRALPTPSPTPSSTTTN
eukprot:Awhi_evm1s7992